MGFETKVQVIRRKSGYEQWYVGFPAACAQMMGFRKGETVVWELGGKGRLLLKRKDDETKETKA
jgi:hypothetical protein